MNWQKNGVSANQTQAAMVGGGDPTNNRALASQQNSASTLQ